MFTRKSPERFSRVDICMSTVVSQNVCGVDSKGAAAAALREVQRLERLLSRFRPDSDVGRLNRAAGGQPLQGVRVHSETMRVLSTALEISRLSGGAFDITAAPLVALWSVTAQSPALPPEDAVAQKRDLVDHHCLTLDATAGSARLAKKGQMVDLGGIAKGYAADRALELYRRRGITSAMIDLGGNVALLGAKEDGSPWNVGIQDPDAPRGECLGSLSLTDTSVVTSGDYERFFEAGGKRYHHIIDPRTGYPAESGLRSVTVVADESMVADGLSTALFVLGLERGLALLEVVRDAANAETTESAPAAGPATSTNPFRSVEALFVTSAGEVHLTSGLKDVYTPLKPAPLRVLV